MVRGAPTIEQGFLRVTDAAEISRDAPGVITIRFHEGIRLTASNTQAVARAHIEAAGGAPSPALVDVRGLRSQDIGSRRIASGPEVTAITSRIAILVASPVARVLANFFIRVTGPAYPVRSFEQEAQARAWLLKVE